MLRKAAASEFIDFIESVRSIVGRVEEEPFSLEDLYFLADCLGLSGVVYLEKLQETRHVNVLVRLTHGNLVLYDPLLGIKHRALTPLHLGLYAKPVGALKTEFEETQGNALARCKQNPWPYFEERGRRLEAFLKGHAVFGSPNRFDAAGLPPLQDRADSRNCAPISLYILSLCRTERILLPHTAPLPAERDIPDCTAALEGPFPCSAT